MRRSPQSHQPPGRLLRHAISSISQGAGLMSLIRGRQPDRGLKLSLRYDSDQDYDRTDRTACQMRWLVVGISMWLTPSGASASITALTIAGSAPTVPASPAPLAPIGLSLVGHGLLSTLIAARSSARGIA